MYDVRMEVTGFHRVREITNSLKTISMYANDKAQYSFKW